MDEITDLRRLLLEGVPMMDVRAPVEFAQGAFPGVANLPLMVDAERHAVGICYKQQGQQAAIVLGHKLVSGDVRRQRVDAWAGFARAHPQGVLYCFRGGLRSQITQQWLASDAGIAYPRVHGGYKALRGFLIDTLEAAARECRFVVLGGLTGTGKTELLQHLPNGLDLEGHANHRGSSFGQRLGGQPSQIDFENRLAIDILRKRAHATDSSGMRFVVEDEGKHVGSCAVPLPLRLALEKAPRIYVNDGFEQRVARILQDYVIDPCAARVAAMGEEQGFADFSAWLQASLQRLARRLGGDRLQKLLASMQRALEQQGQPGDVSLHCDWTADLLNQYYDPMYAYQRRQNTLPVEFEGNRENVLAYLRECGP